MDRRDHSCEKQATAQLQQLKINSGRFFTVLFHKRNQPQPISRDCLFKENQNTRIPEFRLSPPIPADGLTQSALSSGNFPKETVTPVMKNPKMGSIESPTFGKMAPL
jgi:hypothetical protein